MLRPLRYMGTAINNRSSYIDKLLLIDYICFKYAL